MVVGLKTRSELKQHFRQHSIRIIVLFCLEKAPLAKASGVGDVPILLVEYSLALEDNEWS